MIPQYFQATDPGLVRKVQEDCGLCVVPASAEARANKGSLFLVADGMGGQSKGDVASRIAAETIRDAYYRDPSMPPIPSLNTAFHEANQKIRQYADSSSPGDSMGTTVTAVVVLPGRAVVAHVGDSRAYLLRAGGIRQLTKDHTWVSDQVEHQVITPEMAQGHPLKNVVTRSLGTGDNATLDVKEIRVRPGDRLILCTDGLHGVVTEQEIATSCGAGPLDRACAGLIAMANGRGGKDNITVQLVEIPQLTVDRRRLIVPVLGAAIVVVAFAIGLLLWAQLNSPSSLGGGGYSIPLVSTPTPTPNPEPSPTKVTSSTHDKVTPKPTLKPTPVQTGTVQPQYEPPMGQVTPGSITVNEPPPEPVHSAPTARQTPPQGNSAAPTPKPTITPYGTSAPPSPLPTLEPQTKPELAPTAPPSSTNSSQGSSNAPAPATSLAPTGGSPQGNSTSAPPPEQTP